MRNNRKKRILHVSSEEIDVVDIPRALDEMGYDVFHARLGITVLDYCPEHSDKICAAIEEYKVDYVTTYDFLECVSDACMQKQIPYISWVYDAPQKELYSYQVLYPCNYIFVFDEKQCKRMKEIGVSNVFHSPLAIHGEKVKRDLMKFSQKHEHEIVFIGQLYKVKNMDNVIQQLPGNIECDLQKCIDQVFLRWNDNVGVHGLMPDSVVSFFDNYSPIDPEIRYPHISKKFFYEAAFLSRLIANRERIYVLNKLAEKYDMNFYTNDEDTSKLSNKVKIHPGLGYDEGISAIYRDSKINLNITLHCIETGAPQRIFDVMAAGGFMLSNYQKELAEMFVPGEEIVLYHNEEELLQFVEYYLTHEDERKKIARKGQEKVLRMHGFHNKLDRVFDIVSKLESGRRCTYIEEQRAYLYKEAEQKLKTIEIKSLYGIFQNPLYNLVIKQDEKLTKLYEMLYCWKNELDVGEPTIFENVTDIDNAVLKYNMVADVIKIIGGKCDNQVAIDYILSLDQQGVSNFFMAWQINNNASQPKEMFIKFAAYFAQLNLYCAIELLDYALMIFEKDASILISEANYCMQAGLYKEALEVLENIEKPDENVKVIMKQLRNVVEV